MDRLFPQKNIIKSLFEKPTSAAKKEKTTASLNNYLEVGAKSNSYFE